MFDDAAHIFEARQWLDAAWLWRLVDALSKATWTVFRQFHRRLVDLGSKAVVVLLQNIAAFKMKGKQSLPFSTDAAWHNRLHYHYIEQPRDPAASIPPPPIRLISMQSLAGYVLFDSTESSWTSRKIVLRTKNKSIPHQHGYTWQHIDMRNKARSFCYLERRVNLRAATMLRMSWNNILEWTVWSTVSVDKFFFGTIWDSRPINHLVGAIQRPRNRKLSGNACIVGVGLAALFAGKKWFKIGKSTMSLRYKCF